VWLLSNLPRIYETKVDVLDEYYSNKRRKLFLISINNIFVKHCMVQVWNLVCHIKGRTYIEGVWAQGAEENVWILEGGSGGRLEETA
jgi:hypothetical protein